MRALFVTLAACAVLFGAEPKFWEYPVPLYKGKVSTAAATTFGRDFRINFGGKYFINTYACFESDCTNVAIIDIESGATQNLTDVISYKYEPFANHAGYRFIVQGNSSLLALWYLEGDKYGVVDIDAPYRKIYFTFKDGEFTQIAKVEIYPDDFMAFLQNYNKCEDLDGYDPFAGEEMSEEDKQWAADSDKYCKPLEEESQKLLAKYKSNKKVSRQIKNLMER